jgi:hypothetical protein
MGGKSSTTSTTNEPPKWAKPLFEQSAKEAKTLYDKDKGFNVYEGDRVANMNETQRNALSRMGGMGQYAADMDLNAGDFGRLADRSRDQTFAERNLSGVAAGNSLMGDPLFQEMLDAQSAKIGDQANFAASAAGRYGSGMHTGVLAQNVGDFRRQAVLDNYAQERQRQLQANQLLDQNRFQRMGMEGDFFGRQADARQQRFNNIGVGTQSALQAGTFRQQIDQANIDAQMQRWKERDMEDWTRLGALQAAATGAAGPYGMSTQTQNQPFNPMGILGALGGMFMSSDRRLKTNVIRYGSDPRGFGLYEFEYKAQPDVRWRGVMADEVEKVDPVAVVDLGTYKAVNYGRLGLKMERV